MNLGTLSPNQSVDGGYDHRKNWEVRALRPLKNWEVRVLWPSRHWEVGVSNLSETERSAAPGLASLEHPTSQKLKGQSVRPLSFWEVRGSDLSETGRSEHSAKMNPDLTPCHMLILLSLIAGKCNPDLTPCHMLHRLPSGIAISIINYQLYRI